SKRKMRQMTSGIRNHMAAIVECAIWRMIYPAARSVHSAFWTNVCWPSRWCRAPRHVSERIAQVVRLSVLFRVVHCENVDPPPIPLQPGNTDVSRHVQRRPNEVI